MESHVLLAGLDLPAPLSSASMTDMPTTPDFCGARDQTQDFVSARPALYQLSYSPGLSKQIF